MFWEEYSELKIFD